MNDSSFPTALPAGTSLRGGDFVVQNVLGQGGFGITYRALDRALNRTAAIKEFFPQGSQRMGQTVMATGHSDAEFAAARERFLGEARTLAQFNNPNIVNVYTVFEENSSAYMVMEFLDGADLSKTVEERGALAPSKAIEIVEQIGSALETVHRAGMLHLDVKPDNVILAGSTPSAMRAVLLDFGLTRKLETATGYATTRLDAFARFGTAGYAPLEQYSRSGQTGVYTDVYALAATLYFLLTGRAPTEATERASGAPLPDARSFNPSISTSIAAALESGLAMEKQARPQSVQAFLDLLSVPETALQTAPTFPAGSTPQQSTPDPRRAPRPYRDEDDEDSGEDETVEEIMEQLFGAGHPSQSPRRQPPPQRAPNPFQFPQQFPQQTPRRNPFPGSSRVPATSCSCAPGCIGIIIFLYFLLTFLGAVLDG